MRSIRHGTSQLTCLDSKQSSTFSTVVVCPPTKIEPSGAQRRLSVSMSVLTRFTSGLPPPRLIRTTSCPDHRAR
jgi:hypothetical protein